MLNLHQPDGWRGLADIMLNLHQPHGNGVPSPVSGIRMPKLPLLPLLEKGVGRMRGKNARA
jgi:hypothetical protein